MSVPEAAKAFGTGEESPYEWYLGCARHARPLPFAALPAMSLTPLAPLLRRDKRARVEVLWETAKAEITLRNAPDAGKRLSGSRSRRQSRRRGNNTLRPQLLRLEIGVASKLRNPSRAEHLAFAQARALIWPDIRAL